MNRLPLDIVVTWKTAGHETADRKRNGYDPLCVPQRASDRGADPGRTAQSSQRLW